ncbi:hypothetical protein L3Q82_002539 [Scortum barcoo]|uniref:Uncharacterized protein n=1 Tax=Scortum barcoo TaxID=214431 RepID=A0ACB8VY70_9TELE|nr:hypothetical protein L3Q82_002539 [Scortum barcoo]
MTQDNNLHLNVSKTKELIVDFRRRQREEHAPLSINGTTVERVSSFRFLGVHISEDLTWTHHTDFIHKSGPIESILTGCITAWYSSCTALNRKALQREVKAAQHITMWSCHPWRTSTPSGVGRKATKIIKDPSAPGPDNVRRADLQRWDPTGANLANLFNTILVCGEIPKCLKASRSTLIPKSIEGTKLTKASNWRPITIASTILRLFSAIINRQLGSACPAHSRQRGFIDSPGCVENLSIIDGLMRISKNRTRPLGVVFIDFAKVFDSVAHEHILEVLARRGVDRSLL